MQDMTEMYGSYSDEDLNEWERMPQNIRVLTSSAFGAWLLRRDKNIKEQEPKTEWIPVSERLPDEHEWIGTKRFGTTKSDEVYVTFENQKGERFTRHLSFQNGKLSISDQHTIDAFFKGSVPIAWMPLPEPYKEG